MITFYDVWRREFPWIKIADNNCPFTRCGLCEYLKGGLVPTTNRGRPGWVGMPVGLWGLYLTRSCREYWGQQPAQGYYPEIR